MAGVLSGVMFSTWCKYAGWMQETGMFGAKLDMGKRSERREEQEPKTYTQAKKSAKGACYWSGEMRD